MKNCRSKMLIFSIFSNKFIKIKSFVRRQNHDFFQNINEYQFIQLKSTKGNKINKHCPDSVRIYCAVSVGQNQLEIRNPDSRLNISYYYVGSFTSETTSLFRQNEICHINYVALFMRQLMKIN